MTVKEEHMVKNCKKPVVAPSKTVCHQSLPFWLAFAVRVKAVSATLQ